MIKQQILRQMRERWAYEDECLFDIIVTQATGEHIGDNYNNLTAKITEKEAINELLNLQKRDDGVNGFSWNWECNNLFENHKDAVMAWLKDFAGSLGFETITELLADMTKSEGLDFAEDLLYRDTSGKYANDSQAVALIIRQLVYEIAIDLQEKHYESKGA